MHNDEPTLLDILERTELTKEVGDMVAACVPPQVFGIHGDWGLGKTSFLYQVQWYLTGDCTQNPSREQEEEIEKLLPKGKYKNIVHGVWFDAWRYQYENAPIVALLQEIRSQLSWNRKFTKSVARGTEVAVRGALLSMEDLTKKIGFQYSKFRQAGRDWEMENLASALPSNALRDHLREAIKNLLPKKKGYDTPRVAVFIDDIDRCEPEFAYRLLEGLKIYLTLDNCVFVIGMNQKAVEDAIATRFGMRNGTTFPGDNRDQNDSKLKLRASAYMEKLCQNVWQVPTVHDPNESFLTFLRLTVADTDKLDLIRFAIGEYRCLPPNPRRLKGLANLVGRIISRLPSAEGRDIESMTIDARMLMIVAYVYQFHKDIFVRWESEIGFYDGLLDWCTGKVPRADVLKPLELPERNISEDSAPIPSTEMVSTFPDPTETNVFWIQSLILSLGTEVNAEQFRRYLHIGVE